MLIFEPRRPRLLRSEISNFVEYGLFKSSCDLQDTYAKKLDSVVRQVIGENDPYWDSPLSPSSFMSAVKREKRKKTSSNGIFHKFDDLGGSEYLAEFLNFNVFWQVVSLCPEKPNLPLMKLIDSSFGSLGTVKTLARNSVEVGDFSWFWLVYCNKISRLVCFSTPSFWTPFGEPTYVPLISFYLPLLASSDWSAFWDHVSWERANFLFGR